MSRTIKKVLIANRGEIAVRIARSAKEMGIATVALYSEPDRSSPHVLMCDEAYPLAGRSAVETYLNIPKILDIAAKSDADAVHPGYGFLSEKAEFAVAVTGAGLIFIGPRHETIALLGDKTAARELLKSRSLPIVPGTTTPLASAAEAAAAAASIGYPVLIKAAGGGGGKGMRKVANESELAAAMERSANEAAKAFGDPRVYIEKYIEHPKHIEIQVLADSHGNVIHLGERECSIQRRHQKVIEECPSTAVSPELRGAMGDAAIAVCRAAGYVNAATVEFLVDRHHRFYFLEVNTRIQVEHPVTEMVYGIDIVKEQIRIAEGKPLSWRQQDVVPRGHAVECRIYAEETDNDFLPSTGRITHLAPSEGPGIRHDAGARPGSEITMHYDPMIAKLIAHGSDRSEAVARMVRALQEYSISGVKTTIPFCLTVLAHHDFVKGSYDITFVERHHRSAAAPVRHPEAAAVAAAFVAYRDAGNSAVSGSGPPVMPSRWKKEGRR